MKLRICGVDVNIVQSDPVDWAHGGMGRSNQFENRITLRSGMDEDVENAVLLHEVIHMIADMNELKDLRDDEIAVSVLANSLNAFLRDNYNFKWEPMKDGSD